MGEVKYRKISTSLNRNIYETRKVNLRINTLSFIKLIFKYIASYNVLFLQINTGFTQIPKTI